MPATWRFLMIACCVWHASGLTLGAEPEIGRSQVWPFLRGPNFDGHAPSTNLVKVWPAEGPPVLWTRPLGAGYSGFTADESRIFTQYQTLGGQYVICLDGETGDTIWEHRYEGPHDPAGLYPGPRATPTLGPRHVYFAAPSGLIGCLQKENGKPIWSVNLFEKLGVELVEFGYSCSPVMVDDTLFVLVGEPNATLVALNAETGDVIWQAGDEAISHVSPMPIIWNGRRLMLGYLRNVLMAFDLETKTVLWEKPLSTGYDEHAAWPIYREPYLWISAPFRAGSELIELTEEEPGYRTVWKSALLSNDVCSSVLVGDALYGFDLRDVQAKPHRPSRGQFRCLDFLTGKEEWSNGAVNQRRGFEEDAADLVRDESGQLPVGQASVLYADETLILLNDLGELILAKASPEKYDELARVRILGGELCWTQPTLSRGRLYARNHSRAVCVVLSDPDTGEHPVAGPTLRVEDIPQTVYRDWAAWLLPVEPEYAMDAPTIPQLWRWFQISVVGMMLAGVLTLMASITSRAIARRKQPDSDTQDAIPTTRGRWLFPVLIFGIGIVGTTALSSHYAEFLFTWPLALFALFEVLIYQSRSRKTPASHPLGEWLILLLFLAGCVVYFVLCRRLSLAFEWVFLAGFPAAVPALLLARRTKTARWCPRLSEWLFLTLGFAAYYWCSVGLLVWKYQIAWQ